MARMTILRNTVRDHLLGQIERGELTVGSIINLAELSRSIGVSVTPIREALSQLEQAHVLKAVPNRGFMVARLSIMEAKNLYETIAQLEVMALEDSPFTAKDLDALRAQANQLHAINDLNSRFEFHRLLIKNSNNKILLQTLERLKIRLRFYEQAHARDSIFFEKANQQNESIIQAIAQDNIPTAALILKMNWMTVLEHVQRFMNEN